MRFYTLTALALGFVCSSAFAQDVEMAAAASDAAMDCEEAITVFHDVSGFGRRDRAAARMTERHAEMALSGWRFADMQIYSENGDLEGFYLTYTRAASCAPGLTEEMEEVEES